MAEITLAMVYELLQLVGEASDDTNAFVHKIHTDVEDLHSDVNTCSASIDTLTGKINALTLLQSKAIMRTKLDTYKLVKFLTHSIWQTWLVMFNFEERNENGQNQLDIENIKTATDRNITLIISYHSDNWDTDDWITATIINDDAFPHGFRVNLDSVNKVDRDIAGTAVKDYDIKYEVSMTFNRISFLGWALQLINRFKENTIGSGPGEECDLADFSKLFGWNTIPPSDVQWTSEWLQEIFPEWHSGFGGPK